MDLVFYLALFGLILIFGSIDCSIDYDFWARLIVGKSYFQTGTLFNNDFYSYGTTHEFIDHEWGSSLIFYLIQNNFGDIGLYIFKSLIIFLTFFTIIKIIRLEDKNIKLHFLFFFFIIQSICYNIFPTIRCQTFSFLLFAIYLYILKKASVKKNYKILWCIPFLNIIWTNLHGGFAVGLIILFLYTLGEFLNKKEYKPFLIVFIASLLTTLINPYGIKYIYFIFDALNLNRTHITEWKSAFFTKGYSLYLIKFKLLFYSFLGIYFYSLYKNLKIMNFKGYYQKIDKSKYLILLFTILISLKSLRFHVFFSYAMLAFCYVDFYKIFNKKLNPKIDNLKEIILAVLILISTISHLYTYKFTNIVSRGKYPIYCTEFIKLNNLKGNVLTVFHTGSYVAYKLYPNNHVYMDGRYEEVYDTELINYMADFFLAKTKEECDKFLNKFHTDILIMDKNYPVYKILKENPKWFSPLENDNYILFLPIKLKNQKFVQPTQDENYYNKEKFETNINWL